MAGCGNPSGSQAALEVVATYPQKNAVNVRAYGAYYFVFNGKIAPGTDDDIRVSFPGPVTASNETLYFTRNDAPAYDRADTLEVRLLSRPDGSQSSVLYQVAFRTAPGESEDNNSRPLANILRPGNTCDGICGNADNSPSDDDWFMVVPSDNDSFRVTVSLLDTLPLICVRDRSFSAVNLGKTPVVQMSGNDTLFFFMTNLYTINGQEVRLGRNGGYRIEVASLHH
jgi:hypothetical protein